MKTKHAKGIPCDIICTTIAGTGEGFYYLHLWGYYGPKRTRYTICDSDGNHEDATKKEADQFIKDSAEELREYSRHVIASGGDDPLGEFTAPRTKTLKRNVVLHLSRWVGEKKHGLAATTIRLGKELLEPDQVPRGLRDYLTITKFGHRWVVPWKSEAEVREELKDDPDVGCIGNLCSGVLYIKCKAEWKEPRDEKTVRKEIVRAAKRHLATV